MGPEEIIKRLNYQITAAMLESQRIYCPKLQKQEKLGQATKQLMERTAMRSDETTTTEQLKSTDRLISKALRRDIRSFNQRQIELTMGNNNSMKVLRRNLQSGKKEMIKVKVQQGQVTTNREEIYIFKSLSEKNNTSNIEPEIMISKKRIVNQGSEILPEIDEIRLAQ